MGLMCSTVNGRVGHTSRSAFPARHIVINGRRRTGTPATTVVMQPCTTKFAIGMGLMCSTVNGRVGRTSRSAFPAQHIVFSRRRRKGTPATTAVMKMCTAEFRNDMVLMRSTGNGKVGVLMSPCRSMESDKALHLSIQHRHPRDTVVQQRVSCTAMLTDWDLSKAASGPAGRTSRSASPTWPVARYGQRRGIRRAMVAAPVSGVGRTT
jgi:hypothetical protein